MGKYTGKVLEHLDLLKMQLDKTRKWIEFERIGKNESIKLLNDSISKLENIENLIEIDK